MSVRLLLVGALVLLATAAVADGFRGGRIDGLLLYGAVPTANPPSGGGACGDALKFNDACNSQYLGVIL